MTLVKPIRRKRQRGVAMIMALLALLLLAVIGMAFLSMTMTEHSANNNYKDSQKAYFASRAGLENVRALLWSDTNFVTQVANLAMPNTTQSGMIYVLNPTGTEVIDPKANPALDDELCHEQYVLLVATLTPGTAGAPCGAGGAGELMPPASTYYKSAAVPPAPPAPGPDIALNNGEILDTNTTSALPFKWVRVANKQNFMGLMNQNVDGTGAGGPTAGNQVCWDGTQEVVMPTTVPPTTCAVWNAAHTLNQANPVWLLTSLAITPAGSRRMTQMEVAFTPPIYPAAPIVADAPITITGSLLVDGYDNCTCTSTGAPIVAGGICNNSAYAVASGTSITTNGNDSTLLSGQSTPTQILNPWPYNVPNLITNYINDGPVNVSQAPNQVTSCSGTPNFTATPAVYATCSNITGNNGAQAFGTYPTGLPDNPTGSVPQLTYVPGSVSMHADVTGSGVLIIDGDLDVNGSLSWYGLILVRGRISFTGGGSQSVNVYGALLAGEDVNAQDKALDDKVGGSFSFHYDTCALKQDAPPGPPKLLATHELMY